jgi:predicted GNAT family acetyltransferase
VEVEHLTGADAVLERIGKLLLADEARHNLSLGILSTARAHAAVYPELHGWVVWAGALLVGAAIRTPPHNLVLARPADERAIDALAHAIDAELPGVVGAVPEVDAFATAWAKRHHLEVTPAFDQRIYALREVSPLDSVPGAMRLAGAADRQLVLGWIRAFVREALGGADDEGEARVDRSVDARLDASDAGISLWELDGEAVSLAGFGGPTPNGIRIGPVYTPPEHRNHGYGTAVTAAVSQLLLERGHRLCFLYTDLANPTSNAIYLRIGYEPVCDSRELTFSPR